MSKIQEINSVLFRGILLRLNEVYGGNGDIIGSNDSSSRYTFYKAYQRRPVERFQHNYERDKFLHHRDIYIMATLNRRQYVLVELKEREHITMYTKPLELMFGQDAPTASKVLKKLLHKFYSSVVVEDISQVREVDLNRTGNQGNNHRAYNEI